MDDKWVDSFKYCSKDTLDHLSFHDCVCSRMFSDGSNIVFDMVVRYSSSQDMFNELVGESWFEGESFKE